MEYYFNDLAETIQRYYLWILCGVGVPANILAIVTILTMQAMTPATYLVAVLAFCDCSALITKFVFLQLYLNNQVTDLMCKLDFISIFFSTMANWTLATICAERFMSVCFPLKKKRHVTLPRCFACTLLMAGILLCVFIPIFFEMRYFSKLHWSCNTKDQYVEFWVNCWYWLNTCLVLFIPYAVVVTLTLAILIKLKSIFGQENPDSLVADQATAQTPGEEILQEFSRHERTITVMLVSAAVLFLALTLPSCLYFLIGAHHEYFLFQQIQFLLYDSTHAVNFFIYFLAGRSFRQHLMKLFSSCKISRRAKCESSSSNSVMMKPSEKTPLADSFDTSEITSTTICSD